MNLFLRGGLIRDAVVYGIVALLVSLPSTVRAENLPSSQPNRSNPSNRQPDVKAANAQTARTTTTKPAEQPVDERAALGFAHQHHSELADLLQTLKKADKRQYQDALRELWRDTDRLAKMAERDPERYAFALEIWKLDSRIRLELARMTMSDDPEREARLRELLRQRGDARLNSLEFERSRLAGRITKIDEQIANLKSNSDERITTELDRLKKTLAGKGRAKSPAASKSAPKK